MANTFAPSGFLQYQGGAGGAPTFAQSVRRIASSNTTPIFTGDPVQPVTSTANGYITQATAGGSVQIAGIFVGCKYFSTALGRTQWFPYWPGSGATGDIEAYVIDDPNARFIVQSSGSGFPITGTPSSQTSGVQGQLCTFAYSSTGATSGNSTGGNNSTGRSTAYVNATATTNTSPFIIVDYAVSFGNGGDQTTQYCNLIVGFNNEVWRSNSAVTGIS
jgi:hypothetical protein